jgi:hypothetical protein
MAQNAVMRRTEAANRQTISGRPVKNEIGDTLGFEKFLEKSRGFRCDFIIK